MNFKSYCISQRELIKINHWQTSFRFKNQKTIGTEPHIDTHTHTSAKTFLIQFCPLKLKFICVIVIYHFHCDIFSREWKLTPSDSAHTGVKANQTTNSMKVEEGGNFGIYTGNFTHLIEFMGIFPH